MATINLGSIKFNWKGAFNNSTAYAVDDVVSSGGNSYVCIQASQGNAVGNATAYWNIMSSAGAAGAEGGSTTLTTRGDLLYRGASAVARLAKGTAGQVLGQGANDPAWVNGAGKTLTTQGDVLYRDGSGLQRLAKGTAGKALIMNSAANAPEWGTVAGGKVLQVIQKTDITRASFQGSADNSPEAGRCITHLEQVITPSASSSKILITVTINGSASNDAFPNLSFKSSSQVGLGFGGISNGTLVHATSPGGQSPTMGGDYENASQNNRIRTSTYSFLHTANTTNAVYYMPTATIWSGQYFFYNRGETDGGDGWYGAGMSTITLMEIGA